HNFYTNKDNFYKVAEAVVKEWCAILGVPYKAKGSTPAPSVPKPSLPSGQLYKVQVGAFANKENAEALQGRLQKAGFDTYLTVEGKSAPAKPAPKPVDKTPRFVQGEKVRLKTSASKYATGQTIPARYKGKVYTISSDAKPRADRVLLHELYSWVKRSDV